MTSTSLSGRRILVVEDDFYQASDLAKALCQAGADVLGPYPNRERAMDSLKLDEPDCAILDLNLGQGAEFDLADRLFGLEVPFLFYTGYDQVVIPLRFAAVLRLQKPMKIDRLLSALATISTGAASRRAETLE